MNHHVSTLTQSFRELDRVSRKAISPGDPIVATAVLAVAADLERLSAGDLPPASAEELKKAISGLMRLRGDELRAERAGALRTAAVLMFFAGDRHSAFEAAREAFSLAGGLEDSALKLECTTVLGWLHCDAGSLGRSAQSHAMAIQLARERGDRSQEAVSWNFLAWTLYTGAQYEDALTAFERCVSIGVDRVGMMGEVGPDVGMAMCYLHQGQLDRGLEIAQGLVGQAEPKSVGQLNRRAIAEGVHCRALLAVGDVQGAAEHAALATRFAEASGSPRARIVAAMASGIQQVIAGRVNSGARYLRAALKESRLRKTLLRDSLHCLVEAYTFAGEPERAKEYLDELKEEIKDRQFDNLLEYVKHLEDTPFRAGGAVEDALKALADKEKVLDSLVSSQRLRRKIFVAFERRAKAAEDWEDASGEHANRVGTLAGLIAEELGCPPELCRDIEQGARLHDIGKGSIPSKICLKAEPLTPAEREVMQHHSAEGANLLSDTEGLDLNVMRQIVRHHHEWWNGGGYPDRLAGEAIPRGARIAAVADSFDSMTHKRAYRRAFTIVEALSMIKEAAGTQYDPKVVAAFERVITQLRAEERDLDVYLGQESARARNSNRTRRDRTADVASKLRHRGKVPATDGS